MVGFVLSGSVYGSVQPRPPLVAHDKACALLVVRGFLGEGA